MRTSQARRVVGAGIIGVALLVGVAPIADAQYATTTTTSSTTTTTEDHSNTNFTTTTRRATTTTTEATTSTTEDTTPDETTPDGEETTTTTEAPPESVPISDTDEETPNEEPIQSTAETDRTIVLAGEDVGVTAGGGGGEEALPAGATVSVEVKPATEGSTAVFTATATVNADGTVTIDVNVPEGSPPGVYLVVIVLPAQRDANGNITRRPQVAIGALVVRRTVTRNLGASASVETTLPDPLVAKAIQEGNTPEVEAIVSRIVQQVQDAGEQTIIGDVVGGADLVIDGANLLVDGKPVGTDESGPGRGLAASIGLGAAAAGLIVLRRRNASGAV